jgi:hypothetical protein
MKEYEFHPEAEIDLDAIWEPAPYDLRRPGIEHFRNYRRPAPLRSRLGKSILSRAQAVAENGFVVGIVNRDEALAFHTKGRR